MRILIIENKRSGSVKFRNYRSRVEKFLEKNGVFFVGVEVTSAVNSVEDLGLEAIVEREKITHFLVMGGDGSVRRLVEWVLEKNLDICFVVYPMGSANILSRMLGVGKNLDYILRGKTRKIFPFILNGRDVFLIAFCAGSMANVSVRAHDYAKHIFGFFSYIFSGFLHSHKSSGFLWRENFPEKTSWRGQNLQIFSEAFVAKFFGNFARQLTPSSSPLPGGENVQFYGDQIICVRDGAEKLGDHVGFWAKIFRGKLSGQYFSVGEQFKFTLPEEVAIHVDGDLWKMDDGEILVERSERAVKFLV